MAMFKKILIANRGEIAVRIMQTCRKLGIKTVAIYSEADTNALHVKEADEAVFVGPSPSSQSYLRVDNILKAIRQTGADAVHPGYGFLSENANFALELRKAGVALIGPSPEAIKAMGDKIESKKLAIKAGVNVVPGTEDAVHSPEEAKKIAQEIGYPIMIKAAAGGGGKGMRIANDESELLDGLKFAASEAASSFSDSRVFIEKYITKPRHIEIQVLGDKKGNCVYLWERECSIQRRHQKIIEEAPSPFISEEVRKKMGEQSVALAKAVGYTSAGTVEFIVDDKQNFYFLEMNTRLQVEHRVTELITGLDLVEQMIRIAAGEPLAFKQNEIKMDGWAMEARVYAEDPKRGFLPSTGRLSAYQEPQESSDGTVLVDSGVYEGGEVSMFYDPMISKVCTHAKTRDKAADLMLDSLSAYVIQGIAHNIPFLEALLSHPRFRAGDMSTNFITEEYPGGFAGAELTSETTKSLLATAVFLHMREAERANRISGQIPGRSYAIGTRWVVSIDGTEYPVQVRARENGYTVKYDSGVIVVMSDYELGTRLFQGTVNDRSVNVQTRKLAEGYRLNHAGAEVTALVRTPRVAELGAYMPKVSALSKKNQLLAPIAGLVVDVRVEEGQEVKAGQALVVIEAMKMENVIAAEEDVKIRKILVRNSESVAANQVIMEFVEE
jgi:propionyl-CoA carboxylase alpha chain